MKLLWKLFKYSYEANNYSDDWLEIKPGAFKRRNFSVGDTAHSQFQFALSILSTFTLKTFFFSRSAFSGNCKTLFFHDYRRKVNPSKSLN